MAFVQAASIHSDRSERAAASLRRMEEATLRDRRRRYRATTMGERIECAFELSEFARELHAGLRSTR